MCDKVRISAYIVDVGEKQIWVKSMTDVQNFLDESVMLSDRYKEVLMEKIRRVMNEVAEAGRGQGFKEDKHV